MPGYFARIASAIMLPISDSLQPRRIAQDVVDLGADHLVAQLGGLRVGIVDDRLHVGARCDAERLRVAGRPADPVARHRLATTSCSTE